MPWVIREKATEKWAQQYSPLYDPPVEKKDRMVGVIAAWSMIGAFIGFIVGVLVISSMRL